MFQLEIVMGEVDEPPSGVSDSLDVCEPEGWFRCELEGCEEVGVDSGAAPYSICRCSGGRSGSVIGDIAGGSAES